MRQKNQSVLGGQSIVEVCLLACLLILPALAVPAAAQPVTDPCILGLTVIPKQPAISSTMVRHGHRFLRHFTKIDRLIPMLTDGLLVSRTAARLRGVEVQSNLGVGDKTYFFSGETTEPFTNIRHFTAGNETSGGGRIVDGREVAFYSSIPKKVFLLFDIEALDQEAEFHISHVGMADYGRPREGDFVRTNGMSQEQASTSLEQFFNDGRIVGEIVVGGAGISTNKYLRAVWVFPEMRDELIKRLREAGIQSVNGIEIEELIVSPKFDSDYFISSPGTIGVFQRADSTTFGKIIEDHRLVQLSFRSRNVQRANDIFAKLNPVYNFSEEFAARIEHHMAAYRPSPRAPRAENPLEIRDQLEREVAQHPYLKTLNNLDQRAFVNRVLAATGRPGPRFGIRQLLFQELFELRINFPAEDHSLVREIRSLDSSTQIFEKTILRGDELLNEKELMKLNRFQLLELKQAPGTSLPTQQIIDGILRYPY